MPYDTDNRSGITKNASESQSGKKRKSLGELSFDLIPLFYALQESINSWKSNIYLLVSLKYYLIFEQTEKDKKRHKKTKNANHLQTKLP